MFSFLMTGKCTKCCKHMYIQVSFLIVLIFHETFLKYNTNMTNLSLSLWWNFLKMWLYKFHFISILQNSDIKISSDLKINDIHQTRRKWIRGTLHLRAFLNIKFDKFWKLQFYKVKVIMETFIQNRLFFFYS